MLQKKYFTQLYIPRYPFIPTNPLLAAMSFVFSFFFQNIVRLFPTRLNTYKKKLHQMCYCDVRTLQTKSTMYKQCKQNSRNFAKKVLVIKLDPPKDFDKSTRLILIIFLIIPLSPKFYRHLGASFPFIIEVLYFCYT